MTTVPTVALGRATAADYVALAKPRITFMVVLTALVGFVMASPAGFDAGRLALALLGTGLVASGASAFNMLLERDVDALMRRTQHRPLPAGRMRPVEGCLAALAYTLSGLAVLQAFSGPTAAAVALVTWASYVFLYTPLKRLTSLSTIVGAFPGALPPVIGWAAARGQVDAGAFVLFAILFLWQIPHFLAIAWIYREDYARGGLVMLPVIDPEGALTGRQAVANSLALLVVSVMPTLTGMTGWIYLAGATVLGLALTAASVAAAVRRTMVAARRLFLASVLYLAALCTLLLIDRL